MILTDNETKVDLLNNEAIAKTIVELLRGRPDRPVTVGVHGDWGAGKSSVLEMIEAAFDGDAKCLCLKFNGWRFQGFEDAKIALLEGIVSGLLEKRPASNKVTDAAREVYRRLDWLKVAKKAGGLALTAFTGIPTWEQLRDVGGMARTLVALPGKVATRENLDAAAEGAGDLLRPDEESPKVAEQIKAFREAFDQLLKSADVDQLIVLIDDLDRCLPDTAIETLEAVRLFVFTSRTAFVVAADEAMIEYSVRKHFPDLPDTTGPQSYARNYLEKLIQVPFRIPALGETETRIYVTLLLVGAELGEGSSGFAKLIDIARERLRRPWTAGALDAATINKALGAEAAKTREAQVLSDQIGPILAGGTKGNPRQIKRFLNSLLLRRQTAKARGFGDDVKLPVLAKLMLAERFLPRLFERIASDSAATVDGRSEALAQLEQRAADEVDAAAEPANGRAGKAGAGDKPAASTKRTAKGLVQPTAADVAGESASMKEWLASVPAKAWARVLPAIAGEDLRPYLFVAKDRKDFFGPMSIVGHLATIAEQLMGPKLAVQGMDGDLKRLAAEEASQVFEAVRSRIIAGDSFDTEPDGIPGLVVLVRSHALLQGALVDLLEALPREHLGPWVCKGWEGTLKDDALARFNALLEGWAADGSPMLRAAASGTLKSRAGAR